LRYLGIDPGRRRVGLAISDPGATFASPLEVLERRSADQVASEIASLCRHEAVEAVVVGLPLNMDGTKGPAAREAEALAAKVRQATGLPVRMWDERLSSVSAERSLIEADMSRRRRRRTIDKVAAQIILQSFLDAEQDTGSVTPG